MLTARRVWYRYWNQGHVLTLYWFHDWEQHFRAQRASKKLGGFRVYEGGVTGRMGRVEREGP